MKSKVDNARTKVDKRQIWQYLILRQRILNNKVTHPTNETEDSIKACRVRNNEIVMLINAIKKDTIDSKIRGMHQYIHRQNDYIAKLKKDAVHAVGEQDG